MKFDEFDLNPSVLDALDAMGFDECTPIQEQAIPVVLEGNDLIGIAQTGTGKTAAYLLPVISRLYDDNAPTDAINCVVMAPTRELAQQIDHQVEGFGYYLDLSSLPIYGGTDGVTYAMQQRGLKEGADIVIATPGRLLAHLQMGYVDLSRVKYFILDEADRMLDMGFYDDIMKVVSRLPDDRVTLLFSATMPPKIRKLAGNVLRNPKEIRLAPSRPAENIEQAAIVCHEDQKRVILTHLFTTYPTKRVIVFASSKIKCKELARDLKKLGLNAAEIHSDLDQGQRDKVMLDFRAGNTDILVATDIVSRGIDIDDITMVVNYDVPREAEDYVHRIGRTARAGADGRAVTLVSKSDQRFFGRIEKFLKKEITKLTVPDEFGPTPEYRPDSNSSRKPGGNRRGKSGNRKVAQASGRKRRPRRTGPRAEKKSQQKS